MEITPDNYQNAKNRKRLQQQNIKLYVQVNHIAEHVNKFAEEQIVSVLPESDYKHLIQEISTQTKLIKKLRTKIEQFKLQRAKDNVEYIVREEDQLKIAKEKLAKLVDEKEVLTRFKTDKNSQLQNNLPYQHYEESFLEGLTKVVHHNHQQASQITEIERQIRKYHLLRKNLKYQKDLQEKPTSQVDPKELQNVQKQISLKNQQKQQLQKQWKPHLNQLDDDYAKLLTQLNQKKDVVAQLQKSMRAFETRLSPIRDPEQIASQRKRLSQVIVSQKLKQNLSESIEEIKDRKKRRVNQEKLKYQFTKSNEPAQVIQPQTNNKKKEEKIIETMHDDKNISKKIEKGLGLLSKKSNRIDQNNNTDLSLPIKKRNSINPKDELIAKNQNTDQQRTFRFWEADASESSLPKDDKNKGKVVNQKPILRLKQIGMSTEYHLQQEQWAKQ